MNCWEYMKCDRQPAEEKVDELSVCPATTDSALNGINGGINAGRCCWRVAGTYCDGTIQGSTAMKIADCIECGFFKMVQEEEGEHFKFLT